MRKIIPIVEGPGEMEAVPNLIHKCLTALNCYDFMVDAPKNAHGKSNLSKDGGLERFVTLALLEPRCAAVLVIVDADKLCPVELAKAFQARIDLMQPRVPVAVAVAKCEFEAWFLASIETIAGQNLEGRPGIPEGVVYESDPEERHSAKAWISSQLPSGRSYKETEDQVVMTRLMDIDLVYQRSRSFRHLFKCLKTICRSD